MLSRRFALPAIAAVVAAPILPAALAANAPQAGYPQAGCFTFTDPKGDAQFEAFTSDDLDVLGLALEATPTSLRGYAKVAALDPSGPGLPFDGHRYTLKFTFNGHIFSASGSDYGHGTGAIREGLAQTGEAAHTTQLGVDTPAIDDPNGLANKGFVDSGLKVTFDYKNSWVIWDLPIADIEKYGDAKFTGGLTGIGAVAQSDEYAVGSQWDAAPDTDDAGNPTGLWTVGDNKCFGGGTGGGIGAPSTGLSYTGDTKVQYGDTAALAAALVDADGKPVSGASITFAIGKLQTSAKTNTKGIATATLTPKLTAGRYSLVTSYAGKDEGGAVNTPFVVTTGRTVLVLTTTSKKVTASLAGHQKQPIAGQRITWTVNGKSAGSGTTNKRGLATLTHLHKGDHVTAVFKSVKGKYAGSHAKTTV